MKAKTGPPPDSKRARVAIAQSAPVYLDKRASLGKALDLIYQAAKEASQLVAFGESWLPGYPVWLDVCRGAALWDNASTKDVFAKLRDNSITVPGVEVNVLSEAARDLNIAIVIGANERVDAGPESARSTIRFSRFPRTDGSVTITESSFPPTPSDLCGEMGMPAG
jgi:predicted amidohydrolase